MEICGLSFTLAAPTQTALVFAILALGGAFCVGLFAPMARKKEGPWGVCEQLLAAVAMSLSGHLGLIATLPIARAMVVLMGSIIMSTGIFLAGYTKTTCEDFASEALAIGGALVAILGLIVTGIR